jgi:hypothetical protein
MRKLLQLVFGDLRNAGSVALALAAAYALARISPALSGTLLVVILIGAAAVQAF